MRPQALQGVMSGDVTSGQAVHLEQDRPAVADDRRLVDDRRFPRTLAASRLGSARSTDFTTRVDLTGLPAGQEIFYRVTFSGPRRSQDSESCRMTGRLRTAPSGRRDICSHSSGIRPAKGWGINPDWGGMKIYEACGEPQPDFFIHQRRHRSMPTG